MSARPPQAILWDILRGAMTTKALGIVADLRIADALANGPRPIADLAEEVGAHPDSLQRMLRALASDGVFAEMDPGVFGNTDASDLLREGPWHAFAHHFGDSWYRAVGDLEAQTGEATFPRTFGSDFWAWLADHPDERALFDTAMEEGSERRAARLADVPFRGDETVVDVGGGNGSLLLELLAGRPGLRGIVFDLPETVRDESVFGERIEFVEGSFFDRVPAGDVYVLGTILHDWDDEKAAAILRAIREAASPGARVLILDSVIQPGNDPQGAKWLDLLMLVIAAGRERTDPEWLELVEGAGLRVDAIEDGLIQASCR
jgi:O-methyltransferase/methyltransferase family protein